MTGLCGSTQPIFAAEANFYTFQERWAKENKTQKSGKDKALEESFSNAFQNRTVRSEDIRVPAAPTLRRSLAEILSAGGTFELEMNQVLIIDRIGGLLKFVATDEGLVTLENVDSETLKLIGTGIGSTFVHVWNSSGRSTFALRVLPPKIIASRSQDREREALEKTRSFRLGYDNSRNASYTGEKFRAMPRSSVDFTQNARFDGDTPYGELSGHAQTQKSGGKTLLSDAQVVLKDGKIGRFDNFNAFAGDSQVKPDLLVFPGARIRGGVLEHWDDPKKTQWTGFYGRENSSLFGTITPGLQLKRTLNSYLSGGVIDHRLNDTAKVKAGYFTGTGKSRVDELNRRGMGVQTEVGLGPHAVMNNETDFDDEKFAHKHSFTTKFEKLRVKNEFRDVSKKFFTLTGPPSRQGEVGYLLDVSATPSEKWAYSGTLDIFRDRLVPNPEDPNGVNIHTDMVLNYFVCDDLNFTFNFQDLDDTGRLGPSRYRTTGVQYNERFDLWGKKATVFSRYNHRTNHLLTNSASDYRQNQVTLGFYTTLFWGINFSTQKEWNALEEPEISRYTHPSAITYTLDTNRQLWDTPFFAEVRLRIRDEEETESTNSFMAGEDSTEISGGLYYREYEDMELFITGSFTQYVAESLNVASARVEAQFYTGMRYNFDTGLRWGVVGSFDGYVYKDQNGDGVRQPYEPGLANMTVVSSDGKEALTDENGYYQLKAVTGKKVSLTLESSKIPYGFVPTNSVSQELDIKQNETQRSDFGLTPRSDVTGIIFNDLNGNGKYETSEPGVGRVKLTLESGQNARSSGSGAYTFSNVVAGEHTMSLVITSLPEGYLPSQALKKNFTLYEGIRYELHFPLRVKRTVTGRAFFDKNRNKIMDEGEEPLAEVPVSLAGQRVLTDKDGWYLFDDLNQGVYELAADGSKLPMGFKKPMPIKVELSIEPVTLTDLNIAFEKEVPPAPVPQSEEAVYVKNEL